MGVEAGLQEEPRIKRGDDSAFPGLVGQIVCLCTAGGNDSIGEAMYVRG